MKAFWEERFAQPSYIYGKEPNKFFAVSLAELSPGRILLPGEGEGRNAVFAARKGWEVHAFDYSEEAKKKAQALAEETGVEIAYDISSYEDYKLTRDDFDVVGLFYSHAQPEVRKQLHRKAYEGLRTGGVIIAEYFAKEQLGRSSGGPKKAEMLLSAEELQADFKALEIVYLEEIHAVLSEGTYHQGLASIIRLIARKK